MLKSIYTMPIQVGPESIDLLGHVNNREYLRWVEIVATNHAAELGWSFENLQKIARVWVAREHWIEYLHPTFEGESLVMYTWVQSFKRASSLRRYALKRNDELVMTGATEWVFVDSERKRPALITPEIAKTFPVVLPNSDELTALGINRPIRFMPTPGLA